MKEKLIEKQFFLLINGPTCGGKSSVADALCEKYGSIYKAKSDAIKWLISDYDTRIHQNVVHLMTLETIRIALSHGLSVIREGVLPSKPEEYTALAKATTIPFFAVNVSAPLDILAARFAVRIEAKKRGAKISNTDPKRFKELYDAYIETKMKTALEFDSSLQTPEAIAEAIVLYIRTH